MNVTWKVLHTISTPQLEEKLNQLSLEDYDIYRLEFLESSMTENGTILMPSTQPALNVTVNTQPAGYQPQTFQNPPQGYVSSGSMSKTRTRMGYWIIVACRVET